MSQTNTVAEDTVRGQLSMDAFSNWLWSLDDAQLKVFFTACVGAAPGDELDAPLAARKNNLSGWVQCSDDKGWDPDWGRIAARHEFVSVVLDDNFARPLSAEAQTSFAAMAAGTGNALVSQQALEQDKAVWEALQASWAKLRAQELSTAWLLEASLPSSNPVFNEDKETFSQQWHGYSAQASISAEDPAAALFKWIDALDDERKSYVYQSFYDRLYFPDALQKREANEVTAHMADWLAGKDIEGTQSAEKTVLQKAASFNRVIIMHHYLEKALIPQFNPNVLDEFEKKYGPFVNDGKSLEEVVPEMFEHLPPGFDPEEIKTAAEPMIKESYEKLPENRVIFKVYLETWENLKASTLNDRAMRAWYAA